jgi:hypothetical protein
MQNMQNLLEYILTLAFPLPITKYAPQIRVPKQAFDHTLSLHTALEHLLILLMPAIQKMLGAIMRQPHMSGSHAVNEWTALNSEPGGRIGSH